MVVIGFCAIMTPVAVQKATLKRDFPYSVFAALLLMILGGVGMKLGRFDSAVFLVFCHIYRNHDSYGIESRKRRRATAK